MAVGAVRLPHGVATHVELRVAGAVVFTSARARPEFSMQIGNMQNSPAHTHAGSQFRGENNMQISVQCSNRYDVRGLQNQIGFDYFPEA